MKWYAIIYIEFYRKKLKLFWSYLAWSFLTTMLKICIFNLFQGYISITVLNWCIIELRYIYMITMSCQSSEYRSHSVCGCFDVASHIVCMEDDLLKVCKGGAHTGLWLSFLFTTESTVFKCWFPFYHIGTTWWPA